MVVARGDRLTVDDLPERVLAARAPVTDLLVTHDLGGEEVEADYKQQMRLLERRLLLRALERAGGVQTEAAKRLEMPLRTFVHKLKVLGIKRVKGGYDVIDD